jgi:glycosyltransferase involved in cell wall biosynthesis
MINFELPQMKYSEQKGLISIIVPIYNSEEIYLRECLDSILAQTFVNWEAILVNDGSTNNCKEIIDEYAKKDLRFIAINKKQNEGLLLARKTGLENSRGEFIANLDSDDAYSPQFLEKMFVKIKNGNNDFVWCNWKSLSGNMPVGFKYAELGKNKLENIYTFLKFGASVWKKLIKRSIYTKVTFPQIKHTFGEDIIQTCQIVYHSENVEYIPESLYLYRIYSKTSITFNAKSKEERKVHSVIYTIVIYLLMERFFGIADAEKFLTSKFSRFEIYFLLNKKTIKYNKIEYMKNFIIAFLNGLKKNKNKKFRDLLLILACKNFPQLFRIYFVYIKIKNKIKSIWSYI